MKALIDDLNAGIRNDFDSFEAELDAMTESITKAKRPEVQLSLDLCMDGEPQGEEPLDFERKEKPEKFRKTAAARATDFMDDRERKARLRRAMAMRQCSVMELAKQIADGEFSAPADAMIRDLDSGADIGRLSIEPERFDKEYVKDMAGVSVRYVPVKITLSDD